MLRMSKNQKKGKRRARFLPWLQISSESCRISKARTRRRRKREAMLKPARRRMMRRLMPLSLKMASMRRGSALMMKVSMDWMEAKMSRKKMPNWKAMTNILIQRKPHLNLLRLLKNLLKIFLSNIVFLSQDNRRRQGKFKSLAIRWVFLLVNLGRQSGCYRAIQVQEFK
ncbi:uncharacterized protein LOC109832586 isoform X2 [Asparagus officinalis]|uniref:uncharacterized protein LOC109832586 isoform X2 n=1 Tax=Asparagus officinalis TaxID=4686 RepID=UPI00098E725A|nr:uncharacterized protein LOC109832586 isoform X2 [Asparagus officinalis]